MRQTSSVEESRLFRMGSRFSSRAAPARLAQHWYRHQWLLQAWALPAQMGFHPSSPAEIAALIQDCCKSSLLPGISLRTGARRWGNGRCSSAGCRKRINSLSLRADRIMGSLMLQLIISFVPALCCCHCEFGAWPWSSLQVQKSRSTSMCALWEDVATGIGLVGRDG